MRGRKPSPVVKMPGVQEIPNRPTQLMGKPKAIAAWKRIVGLLQKRGLWQDAAEDTIIIIANAWERYSRMEDHIEAHGEVIEDARGSFKSNPAVRIMKAAEDTISRNMEQLGLTPTAARKTGGAEPEQDEFIELLRGMNV